MLFAGEAVHQEHGEERQEPDHLPGAHPQGPDHSHGPAVDGHKVCQKTSRNLWRCIDVQVQNQDAVANERGKCKRSKSSNLHTLVLKTDTMATIASWMSTNLYNVRPQIDIFWHSCMKMNIWVLGDFTKWPKSPAGPATLKQKWIIQCIQCTHFLELFSTIDIFIKGGVFSCHLTACHYPPPSLPTYYTLLKNTTIEHKQSWRGKPPPSCWNTDNFLFLLKPVIHRGGSFSFNNINI